MSEFSAADVAFEGFRITRERPAAIALWSFAWMAMAVVMGVIAVKLGGVALNNLMAFATNPPAQPDVPRIMKLYADLMPMVAVITPVSLIFYSIMMTAVYRLVLDRSSRLGLQLGVDELRQVALMVILSLGFFVVYLLLGFAAGLVVAIAMALNQIIGALMVVVALVGVAAGLIYLSARFSLAGPQTFDTKRINVLGSWAMTKGRFWPIFGAYLLSAVFALIVSLLGTLVIQGIFAFVGGGYAAQLKINASSLVTYFTPLRVASLACSSVLSALTWAILICPSVAIYRRLREGPQGVF